MKNKIMLLRAKEYASKIEGTSEYHLSLMSDDKLCLVREKISDFISCSIDEKTFRHSHPINADSFSAEISAMWPEEHHCSLLFDGYVAISFNVEERQKFISSIFHINRTYDAALIFNHQLIYISDEEYGVGVYNALYR